MAEPGEPTREDIEAAKEIFKLDNALRASGWRDTVYRTADGRWIHLHETMNDWDFTIIESRYWLNEAEALLKRLRAEAAKQDD